MPVKIKQLSPDILKFRIKQEDNPFTLNYFVVPRSFLFVFHAGLRGLGSNNCLNSSYKEKTVGSARASRLSFRFLWLWLDYHCSVVHGQIHVTLYSTYLLNNENYNRVS